MGAMLKQAMEVKNNIEEMKEKLGEERVEGSAGGGMVSVVMSGKLDVISVKIDPEVVNPADVEMLETLVRAALNEAAGKARELVKQKMTEITGGLDIPGVTS
jgi:DNA-binding YbaB/EbfC family protein